MKPVLLPKLKPLPANSAAFHGSSFGLRLFRVLLRVFTFHGTYAFWFWSHSLLSPRLETSLYYSGELVKLHTSLYSSISMFDICFLIQNVPSVYRTKIQLHSETAMTVGPWKTTQIPGPPFSTMQSQGFWSDFSNTSLTPW